VTMPVAPGAPGGPQFVLLEKAEPVRVMRPDNVAPDTTTSPLPTRGFNSCIVDVVPGPAAGVTSVTMLGAPTPGGPWVQEVDPNAFQSGLSVTAAHRFVVTGISAFTAVSLTAPVGWTVWLTLYNAATQTNIAVTGTSNMNLAQVGGVAISAGNPVPTSVTGQPITATTTPAQASVQRISAGFMAAGQTAKSYTGSAFTPAADAAPGAPTVAVGSAGVLTGAYTYKVTFVTAQGETSGGTTSATVNPSSQQVNLSAIPVGAATLPVPVTARKIYRSKAGGIDGFQQLVTTLNDNTTTTYTDNTADGSLGVQVPLRNTSAQLTIALWTVTSGKTWILTDLLVTCDASSQVLFRIQAAGADIFRGLVRDIEPLEMPGMETQPNASSTQAVTIVLNGTSAPQEVNWTLEAVEQ
jgi:hypothetical protein